MVELKVVSVENLIVMPYANIWDVTVNFSCPLKPAAHRYIPSVAIRYDELISVSLGCDSAPVDPGGSLVD